MRRLATLLALLMASADVEAAETALFLNVQPGARPMALGEAFTAVPGDLNALTNNPSGLAGLPGREAGFTDASLYGVANYDFAAVALPMRPATFGVSVARLAQSSIDGRDASGNATGSFGAADTAVALTGASRAGGFLLGGSVKYIDSQIAQSSAHTLAADAGVMRAFRVGEVPLTAGFALKNMGPGLNYGGGAEPLPFTASAGLSATLAGSLLLTADLSRQPGAGLTQFSFGTEYAVLGTLAMRLGYGTSSDLGAGFGLKLGAVAIDYAFTPAGDLGNAQRLSLTTRF